MAIDQAEEEQVEALKKWWDENGKSLIVGLVIGLGAIAGYRGWEDYQAEQAQRASLAYEQLRASTEESDSNYNSEQVIAQSNQLIADYPESPYASFAGLVLAAAYLQAENPDAAKSALEAVMANATQPELREVARIRLARLSLSTGDLDAAESQLGATPAAGFESLHAELLGDIQFEKGNYSDARTAWLSAVAAGSHNQALIMMKLDDLGDAE